MLTNSAVNTLKNYRSTERAPRMRALLGVAAIAMLALSACSDKPDTKTDETDLVVVEVITFDIEEAVVLGETEYGEVIRVDLPAGQYIPPHTGGDRVILSLTDYEVTFEKTGEVDIREFKAGDVHYHPAGPHEIFNTGSSPAEFVIFERFSSGALPSGEPAPVTDDTPMADEGATETQMFSNAAFDVFKVSVEPGGKLAPHKGYARAIFSLDDYGIEFHENGKTEQRTFASGQVHFHNPGNHWLKNTGETMADFIIVDYKK